MQRGAFSYLNEAGLSIDTLFGILAAGKGKYVSAFTLLTAASRVAAFAATQNVKYGYLFYGVLNVSTGGGNLTSAAGITGGSPTVAHNFIAQNNTTGIAMAAASSSGGLTSTIAVTGTGDRGVLAFGTALKTTANGNLFVDINYSVGSGAALRDGAAFYVWPIE